MNELSITESWNWGECMESVFSAFGSVAASAHIHIQSTASSGEYEVIVIINNDAGYNQREGD